MAEPITETVPKAELDQAKAQAAEATRTMETLKNQLLEPEYLSYLESRRAPKTPPAVPAASGGTSVANMTLEQLQGMLASGIANTVQEALKPVVTRLNDVSVKQELAEVMDRHTDFPQFREDVVKILQTSANELTIEQAYLMAKAQAPVAPATPPATPPVAPKGNEKPSGHVPLENSGKEFKTPEEAGKAAWAEVAKTHGLSGDSI